MRGVRVEGAEELRQNAPAGNVSLIAAELMAARCRWCNDELEHCHESLVSHVSGRAGCMNASCDVAVEAHHLVVSCSEFGCPCGATAVNTA